ncbi:Hypothetical_protein [Hexamita inflata]|uniref:Hypothetical_protein n=1 Tax=Hexamita inflata TaxID=28002 RepID=A0AA86QDV3_9EUKA|nr:Hypothetical protein HINF_LOCUS44555 [Hexamita inflata]
MRYQFNTQNTVSLIFLFVFLHLVFSYAINFAVQYKSATKDQYQYIRLYIAGTSYFNHIFFLQIVHRKAYTISYARPKRVLPREDDINDQTDPYAIELNFSRLLILFVIDYRYLNFTTLLENCQVIVSYLEF